MKLIDKQLQNLTTQRLVRLLRSTNKELTNLRLYGPYRDIKYETQREKAIQDSFKEIEEIETYRERIKDILSAREHLDKK